MRYAVLNFDGSFESANVINWFKNNCKCPILLNAKLTYDLNDKKITLIPHSPKYSISAGESYIFDIRKNWIYTNKHMSNDIVYTLLKKSSETLNKLYKVFEFDESEIDYTADLDQFCTLLTL